MNLRVALFAQLLLCASRTALAGPALPPSRSSIGSQIEALAHVGVATSPFDGRALPEAKGQALWFLASGRYALSDPLAFELHVPFVLGSVAQPAGSYIDTAALGNPELAVRHRLWETQARESLLALSGAIAVGAPLASHAEDLMPNRLLAVADGLEGRGRPEWFTPGVFPVTASGTLSWASESWNIEGELRLPLLVRVSEADLPDGTTNSNSFGLASVLGLRARYRLSRRLSLASAAHLFFDLVPAVEHVRAVSRVQDFEQLSLHIHFGSLAALIVDLQTAIGGELGGSTVAGGLRALVTFR